MYRNPADKTGTNAVVTRKLTARFCSDTYGATSIEYVFIIPVIVLLILGIVSFGTVIYQSATLQGALNNAAREGKTGYPDITVKGLSSAGDARWLNTKTMFTNETKALFNPQKLTYTVTSYGNFADATATPPRNGTPGSLGVGGSVVVYQATYPYPTIPLVQQMFGKNATIKATCIVKNEDF